MARVLFIVKDLKMEPLGIMYLSAALKKAGHEVELVRMENQGYSDVIYEYEPDFVAYSVCSGLEDYYFELNAEVKIYLTPPAVFPKSIWGGPSVTFSPERYESLPLSHYVRGEGESAIVDIVEGRTPKHLRLVDVNAIPSPDREIAYQFEDLRNNPIKNIISRRGCKYSCSYCFNREWNRLHRSQMKKEIIRHRSVDSVIAEGADIKAKYPVKLINFVDDNFVTSLPWLENFSAKWKEQVGLPFFCSVRPDDATDYNIYLIAEAGGAVINMAIESANDENRRKILTRSGKKGAVKRTLEWVHKYGMRSRLQNIIGLPVDDPLADAYETLDFNIECQPTSSWCALLQAYEGTEIYEIARKKGCIPEDSAVDKEFFGVSTLKIRDRRKIERLHKLWHFVVRYPFLRRLVPVLIRLPLPFFMWRWFFQWTKKRLAEKELWQVFG